MKGYHMSNKKLSEIESEKSKTPEPKRSPLSDVEDLHITKTNYLDEEVEYHGCNAKRIDSELSDGTIYLGYLE
jgi:hypothetical protein